VVGSPSVTETLANLIAFFQKLKDSSWYISKNADELRSIFVHTVMGDYLRCFRCKSCNAQFVINKEPQYKSISNYYQCPSCHASYMVEPDDSFLKAMVSEKQVENTQYLKEVLEEIQTLKPFKAFLSVPCEICHEKIEKWDDYNVKLAMQGIGCGHTACWNSDLGRMRELARALTIIKRQVK
jgi:DNA-directed RNA polymerase subunit M/transcription elongation factor TFIIS